MKIFIEQDNRKIEVREIESINPDSDLLFFILSRSLILSEDVEKLEKVLNDKTGKKCIVLDGTFRKVLGL